MVEDSETINDDNASYFSGNFNRTRWLSDKNFIICYTQKKIKTITNKVVTLFTINGSLPTIPGQITLCFIQAL